MEFTLGLYGFLWLIEKIGTAIVFIVLLPIPIWAYICSSIEHRRFMQDEERLSHTTSKTSGKKSLG